MTSVDDLRAAVAKADEVPACHSASCNDQCGLERLPRGIAPWLAYVLKDASEKVSQWPEWLRSDDVKREVRKRRGLDCHHTSDHNNACTGSNEPGQEGSVYR